MTNEEVRQALAGETERVEWKQSSRSPEPILQAACALANDLGNSGRSGFIVLGLAKDGTMVGVHGNLDEEQQKLVNRLSSTKLLPSPSCSVEPVEREGAILLIVRVQPYPVPPIVALDGTVWIRRGTVTERAREADIIRLQERRPENRQPFDHRSVPGCSIEDLAEVELKAQYLAAQEGDHDADTFPAFPKWLTGKDLGRAVAGRWMPNAAAILLFGVDPQFQFPGAKIEFARYAGTDIEAPVVARRTIPGTLGRQLDALWVQLDANLANVPVSPSGMRTPYRPEYPPMALKELARNLVQHRLYEGTNAPGRVEWYTDRVVFTNPGGPFGQAGEGEFGSHTDYRNPTITRWLVDLGYVEQLGRGIRLVRRALEENGNPPLEVETDGFTTVTLRGMK
jgi:ATP-dependent DNA helicase RecG